MIFKSWHTIEEKIKSNHAVFSSWGSFTFSPTSPIGPSSPGGPTRPFGPSGPSSPLGPGTPSSPCSHQTGGARRVMSSVWLFTMQHRWTTIDQDLTLSPLVPKSPLIPGNPSSPYQHRANTQDGVSASRRITNEISGGKALNSLAFGDI